MGWNSYNCIFHQIKAHFIIVPWKRKPSNLESSYDKILLLLHGEEMDAENTKERRTSCTVPNGGGEESSGQGYIICQDRVLYTIEPPFANVISIPFMKLPNHWPS
jgi:hypothetical protein